MRALITGINGFAGRHLARCLLASGVSVFGATRQSESNDSENPGVRLIPWEIRDSASVSGLVREIKPDQIYHLASMTSEAEMARAPDLAYQVNVVGTEYLLDAVLHFAPQAAVLLAGSSAEYGVARADENPIDEAASLRPVTLYGVTKAAQSLTGQRYWLAHGLRVMRARAFNYAGPGQSDRFVIASLCRKLSELERSSGERILTTGNLDGCRDFTDVRDVVRAYQLLIAQGRPGEIYNIASGATHRIGDLLDQLLGMIEATIAVSAPAPTASNGADVPIQVGNAEKLRRLTGWTPRIPIETTLRDTLEYWRARVPSNGRTL